MVHVAATPSPYTTDDLAEQIRLLGVRRGDVVLVRAALKPLGKTQEPAGTALVQALIDTVGEQGGILGLSFTSNHLWPKPDRAHLYHRELKATTGGFANCLLSWPGAVRSEHPTNSFVAVGRGAIEVIRGHNAGVSCFAPMGVLVERRGKMLLVGCVHDSPGFSTVHWAQEQLGLSTKNIVRGLFGAAYEDHGTLRVYRKHDTPGCSMGFSNFYGRYVDAGLLTAGFVGDAYSILIDADKAFELEMAILREDPKFALCDRPDCFSCRGTLLYNVRDWPKFYARYFPAVVRKQWSKIARKRKPT